MGHRKTTVKAVAVSFAIPAAVGRHPGKRTTFPCLAQGSGLTIPLREGVNARHVNARNNVSELTIKAMGDSNEFAGTQ